MTDFIKLLPDHVANQIAAGEVVQRPASVVKELLENAIDAGASRIKLILKDSGKTLIQVVDDGKGMSTTDARLCFERHATSKITSANDLFALHTKGFRGEALASIAAVAHIDLNTRTEDQEVGTTIAIAGSEIVSQEVVACPKGTSIAVKNLFYNIPARRKFLKSDTVELRHIIDEFHRVALAHENLTFIMYHNGTEVFNLHPTNKRQRIVAIFGSKTNEKLVPVTEETEIVTINGFVYKPAFVKKTKGEQFFFVNDRYIKHPYLYHAVQSAFEGLLPERSRASYFIYLTVKPETIDINIHPTKTEIKFEDEQAIYTLLKATVKHSLGQFNIAPLLDFERDTGFDTPYSFKDKMAQMPKIQIDRAFNPFDQESSRKISSTKSEKSDASEIEAWNEVYAESKISAQTIPSHTVTYDSPFSTLESDVEVSTLFEEDNAGESNTFQLQQKYIVSTIKGGMLVIDQHRAHQRILYEDFLKSITIQDSVSQQLLFPLQLNYTTSEIALLNQLKESLDHTGFIFEQVGADSIQVTGIPSGILEREVSMIVERLLFEMQNEIPDTDYSQTDFVAKCLSRSMAVRGGEKLDSSSRGYLLNKLFACKEPTLSPFNKKTFITVTVEELTRKFSI